MRFQTKMIATYTVFILMVGIIIAIFYYNYGVSQYRETEEKNLEVAARQVVNQMDELIKPMETRTRYILSDPQILESIRFLASPPYGEAYASYVDEARTTIRAGLVLDYVMNDFYRVILFNPGGDIITSRTRPPMVTGVVEEMEDMPWLGGVDAANGQPVLIGAHEDNWGVRARPQVFSLMRAIQGKGMGYIEIQRTVDSVAQAITLPKENLDALVFLGDGQLLYAGDSIEDPEGYRELLPQEDDPDVNMVTTDAKLIAIDHSSAYDVVVMVVESMADVEAASNSVAPLTVGIAVIFCIISLIFVLVASRFLTKPLRQLRDVMEQTQLANLGQEIHVSMPNDELEALNLSYQNVMERLRESIVKEKQTSLLQAQAQFDLLQAQVNPHFLYNVLNVIAQRGMENGDEEICDLCASLASMLRYSTSTRQRYAPISQELEYLEQYFYLMKSRYKQKLCFCVDVDPAIHGQVIPRIALQQLVENCINHGFANTTGNMVVEITGWRDRDRWVIRVRDNGQGIDPAKLEEINAQLGEMRHRLAQQRDSVEMEIGGMGLVNTFARLYLLYGEALVFELRNYNGHGTEVLISTVWDEEGSIDVSGDGGGG